MDMQVGSCGVVGRRGTSWIEADCGGFNLGWEGGG
jgi:hypothetical protein